MLGDVDDRSAVRIRNPDHLEPHQITEDSTEQCTLGGLRSDTKAHRGQEGPSGWKVEHRWKRASLTSTEMFEVFSSVSWARLEDCRTAYFRMGTKPLRGFCFCSTLVAHVWSRQHQDKTQKKNRAPSRTVPTGQNICFNMSKSFRVDFYQGFPMCFSHEKKDAFHPINISMLKTQRRLLSPLHVITSVDVHSRCTSSVTCPRSRSRSWCSPSCCNAIGKERMGCSEGLWGVWRRMGGCGSFWLLFWCEIT